VSGFTQKKKERSKREWERQVQEVFGMGG
jgi:hypothetical protein